MFVRTVVAVVLSLALSGCGGGQNSFSGTADPGQQPNPNAPLTNNWKLAFRSVDYPDSYGGAWMTRSANTISGIARVFDFSDCLHWDDPAQIVGTVVGDSVDLDLLGGTQELKITGRLSADGQSLYSATWVVTAGCGFGANGPLLAHALPALDGHFVGTLRNSWMGDETIAFTADLQQGTELNESGFLPVTGTISFTPGLCGVKTATTTDLFVSGPNLAGSFPVGDAQLWFFWLRGDAAMVHFSGDFNTTGNCPGKQGTVDMGRQP